ncbi:MAG: beta-propeller domain-containing protein [Oscillospiraceae bacterium]|jgi:hypothetical protein|nr:beta-propeller domain-containing protein [Oscillospiraceae bacterium]
MIEVINAGVFLTEIKKLNLSGRDFLEIIGNSKISNDIYSEIKESDGLTYERLVELLEGSALVSGDYARLLKDASALARLREHQNRKKSEEKLSLALVQAQKRLEEQERLERLEASRKAEQLLTEARKKIKEERQRENSATREVTKTLEIPVSDDVSAIEGGAFEAEADFSEESGAYAIGEDGEITQNEDEDDDDDEIIHVSAADNKGALVFCFFMALVLTCASFAVRWFMTGSFLIERERAIVLFVPETYFELAERLLGAGDSPSIREAPEIIHKTTTAENPRKTLLFNERYIFNIMDNTIFAIEFQSGSMSKVAEIEYYGEQIREMYLLNERLYVISEFESERSYRHEEVILAGGGVHETADPPEITLIEGDFTQKMVSVRVYNARDFKVQPELTFTADGGYNTVLLHKNKLILATDYTPHEPRAHSDLTAFVPAYFMDGEMNFADMSNIYAPPAPLMNTDMTVISVIDGESAAVFVTAGGAGSVYLGEDALFIAQTAGKKSRLIRLDVTGENEQEASAASIFCDIDGVIPVGAVSERHSILRVGAYNNDKGALYIFNNELDLLSRVINIGNEPPRSILFDNSFVYFIGDRLYVFDTTNPGDVTPADEPFAHIYSDDFLRISALERLEIAVEVDADGRRAGIRLNVHKGESVTATHLITAESNVAGNWNPFLFTDAEYDKEAVFICEQKGIIIIPIKYSNGIADIEKVLIFDYDGANLTKRNEIVYVYELGGGNERRRAILADGYIYSFWGMTAVSAGAADGVVADKIELQ